MAEIEELRTPLPFWPKARATLGSPVLILSADTLSTLHVPGPRQDTSTEVNEAGLALGGVGAEKASCDVQDGEQSLRTHGFQIFQIICPISKQCFAPPVQAYLFRIYARAPILI